MKKTINNRSRLNDIERKCDRIIAELRFLRQRLTRQTDIDCIIDRMHRSARMMLMQCRRERDAARGMFEPKAPRR